MLFGKLPLGQRLVGDGQGERQLRRRQTAAHLLAHLFRLALLLDVGQMGNESEPGFGKVVA